MSQNLHNERNDMTNLQETLAHLATRLQQERRECHRRVLSLLDDLTDEDIRRRPGAQAPSIGFRLALGEMGRPRCSANRRPTAGLEGSSSRRGMGISSCPPR
jgi:hypothetical protein